MGIIGPNGSGKSSLLRCIYRASLPQGGVVLLDGRDLWRMPAKEAARHAAAVPQEMLTQLEFTVRKCEELGSDVPFCAVGQAVMNEKLLWKICKSDIAATCVRATGRGTHIRKTTH